MMKTFKTRKSSKIRHIFIFDFANGEFCDALLKEEKPGLAQKGEYREVIIKASTF